MPLSLRRRPLAAMLIASALGFVLQSRGLAQTQRGFLFDAPCADADDFTARVERLLPQGEHATPLLYGGSIRVSLESEGFVLRSELPAHAGLAADHRELREASCDALLDAAAIMVSLRWHEQQRLAAEAARKPQAPVEPEPTPHRAQPPPQRTLRVALALGAGAGTGLLPGLALGPDLGVGLETNSLRFMIAGRYWPEETARLSADSAAGGTASLIELLPSAAWLPLRLSAFRFGGQLVFAAGRLTARGVFIAVPETDHAWLLRSDLNVCAHVSLASLPVAGFVAVGAGVPWSRPDLRIEGRGHVFQLAPVGFRASIAAELHID